MPIAGNISQRQNKYFIFSFFLFSFYALTSVLRGLSAIAVQMPIVMISFFFLFLSVFSTKGKQFASNFLLITFITIVFNYFFIYKQGGVGEGTLQNKIGANFTLFSTSMPLLFACSEGLKRIDRNKTKLFVLIIVAITSLTTIIGTFKYETPCRELATPYNTELDNLYKSQNIGGYGFIYFLVLITPLLMRELHEKFSLVYLGLLILNSYCVIRSEYTTAILLLFVSFCLGIIIWSKSIFVRMVTASVALIIPINFENIMLWAIDFFTPISFTISTRLHMFLLYRRNDSATGDVQIRQELYQKSWNSFLRNPLVGGLFRDEHSVGGHSELLDYIGFSGLWGVIVLIICISYLRHYTAIRFICFKDPFICLVFVIAVALAALNTFSSPELFYALLIMPLLIDTNEQTEIYDISKERKT